MVATMFKDGYDDYHRHKSDNQINSKVVNVLTQDGKLEKWKWQDIETGDIIQVNNDEPIAVKKIFF